MRRTITCLHCGQTRAHRAFGLCSICYMRDLRKRQGSVKRECAHCHRMMHIWAAGICRTCYQHCKDNGYTPPEPQPTRLVNTMNQGHRLRELRKRRNMTRAQTVTHMRARGFPWTDNTIGNLEAGNRRISLNEAIALMETYGYIGANMFYAFNYILERTA